jgi:hypothetical protein
MLRSPRMIASLIRSLVLGSATAVATITVSSALVGCKDEGQPDYWVDKLEDPAWRPRAIKRLEQFYEDSLTKAGKDEQAPEVKALLDLIVEPLTRTYVEQYDALDTKTRVTLVKLLASMRDKRTEPALKKALDEFAKRPKTTKDEQDIKWAARAAAELKLPSLTQPMLETFMKLKASSMLGGIVYKDYNEAMVAVADKSWVGPLVKMLEAEIKVPKDAKEKDAVSDYRDQLFWQTTSAEVLGLIADASAVEPLMKVMLDPAKADIQATALLAMVKIGKPSVAQAVKLLQANDDDKLAAYNLTRIKEVTKAKKAPEDKPYKQTAALILGTIGRSEGIAPMVAALQAADKEPNKAVIARELTKMPQSPESKAAFKAAYESISINTNIPPGINALQMLTEAAGQWFDPDMMPWLLERAERTKGGGEDIKALQGAITVTALKLAKPDQLEDVKKAVDKYGTKIEKDMYALVEKQVKACGDRVQCYLAEIEKSENQDQKTQFGGIKAGYMIAILGNDQTRAELIERLDSVENAAVRYVAASAIDHLSPKGSDEAAKKIRAIIQKNVKSADRDKVAGDAPLKQVMYRLDARGG